MGSSASDVMLFGFEIICLAVYIIFMYSIHKYRDRSPFNTPFFKLIFVLGIIDISKEIEEILLFKCTGFAWLGLNKLVTSVPFFFGKVHVVFQWYFSHAQVVGILLVAVNRVSVCGFLKEWTRYQLRITFLILWGLPLILNVPLWLNEFYFSDNGTDGEAFIYWKNTELRWYYTAACGILCSAIAISSGVCYLIIVVKKYQVNKQVAKAKQQNERKEREEKKLMFIGVVLSIIVGFCGFSCIMFAYAIDPKTMAMILPIIHLNDNLLFWVNPFLMLACSPAVRKHFKAVFMCRPPNAIHPNQT